MVTFVTYDYYIDKYKGKSIHDEELFCRYAPLASMEIRNASFGRINELLAPFADEIQITACQVVDILEEKDSMNGNVSSETNDGDSITYNDARDFRKEIQECIIKNLWMTGLLYQGCDFK